jgi:predicted MFS family arabinose efflux permease
LAGTNLLRALLVLLLPIFPEKFPILLLFTFLVSTLTQFFAPAETTTIPLILERRYLLAANSLFTTTMMGSLILGFALGEPLLALVGVHQGHWLVGGAYGAATLLLLGVKTGEQKSQRAIPKASVFEDLKDGIAYLTANRSVRVALLQLVVLFSILAALTILAVSLGTSVGLKEQQFGFLLAAAGAGLAVGAWGLGQFGDRFQRTQLTFWGSLVIGLALMGLALVKSLVIILLFCGLLGLAASAVGIPMQTVIQEETPPDLRGKIFGLQNNAVNIALTVPQALAGVAADAFGLQPVILCIALAALGSAFLLRTTNQFD